MAVADALKVPSEALHVTLSYEPLTPVAVSVLEPFAPNVADEAVILAPAVVHLGITSILPTSPVKTVPPAFEIFAMILTEEAAALPVIVILPLEVLMVTFPDGAEDHVMSVLEYVAPVCVIDGVIEAVVSPTATKPGIVAATLTPVADIFTVLDPPPEETALITAFPAPTTVTLPVESTVATEGVSDDQVIVPPVGVVDAARVCVSPTLRLRGPAGVIVTVSPETVISYDT